MRSRRAMTLIELLIVVAIIAILSAAALAVVVAPLADVLRSRAEARLNGGFGMLHAALVADLHDAREARIGADGSELEVVGPDGTAVVYAVDEGGTLRRRRGDEAAIALVPDVSDAAFSLDGPFVQFEVGARTVGWDRDMHVRRGGRIAVDVFGGEVLP